VGIDTKLSKKGLIILEIHLFRKAG
jgi:hypothetical protein